MSLDVYLNGDKAVKKSGSGIFIRENGKTIQISEEEWYQRNPDREPVRFQSDEETNEIYHDNITHNLGKMADAAGIYYALWRPEEKGWKKAIDIAPVLQEGLKKLKADPDKFKKLNPENGWGTYEGLVEFVFNYMNACWEYPNAEIEVSR